MPRDECCVVYEESYFQGKERIYCNNRESEYFFDFKDYDSNEKMSSYICGKNVSAQFCMGDLDKDCLNGSTISAAGNTRNPAVRPNDELTGVWLYPYDTDIDGTVTLYDNDDCEGI